MQKPMIAFIVYIDSNQDPIWTKIIIDSQMLRLVTHFNSLGCDIIHDKEKDILNPVKYEENHCKILK